jgi:hypothetical protein
MEIKREKSLGIEEIQQKNAKGEFARPREVAVASQVYQDIRILGSPRSEC